MCKALAAAAAAAAASYIGYSIYRNRVDDSVHWVPPQVSSSGDGAVREWLASGQGEIPSDAGGQDVHNILRAASSGRWTGDSEPQAA